MQGPISFTTTAQRQVTARRLPRWIVVLPVVGALILGIFAYQLPTRTRIDIGSPGDQLFLDSSEALDATPDAAGHWYPDELGDGQRSRWTRSRARMTFPSVGGGDAEITLRVQGWPTDVTRAEPRQPLVTVQVLPPTTLGSPDRGMEVARFTPTAEWDEYHVSIPASARASDTLVVDLELSAIFTTTQQFSGDVRPKGIRVDWVNVETTRPVGLFRAGGYPLSVPVLQLMGAALLATVAVRRQTPRVALAVLFGLGVASTGAASLALWRPWAAALMPLLLGLAAGGLLLAARPAILRVGYAAGSRMRWSRGLTIGGVVALVLSSLVLAVAWVRRTGSPIDVAQWTDPAWVKQFLPVIAGGVLVLAAGPTVLPRMLRWLQYRLLVGWLTPLLLAVAGGVILGWELQLLRLLPFVGHADYADNAVVARSLLRGEGWRVPYVTQFYELVPGGSVYRPQETWPLLQPVWMVPWMALFGPTAFAARIANIIFNLLLLLLVYHIGATLWDRRVGAMAALLTLLNHFFFLLTIYSTTDLGFTVLSMAALWLFFRGSIAARHAVAEVRSDGTSHRGIMRGHFIWMAAGIMTGLMVLQKPTGALFGAAMVLWALVGWYQGHGLAWRGLLVWAVTAGLVVLPYVTRNFILFGQPLFSTESYDAWILGYRGPSKEAWEDIYRFYLGDLPDKSWLLRIGWDHVVAKLLTQVREVRAYFVPPQARLLGAPATWLVLGGLLAVRIGYPLGVRPLIGLVLLVAGLYTAFLVTYWHANEERYFVPFVPWMLLLAAAGLCAAFDRVMSYRRGQWAGLAGALSVLLLWSVLHPEIRKIDSFLDPERGAYWGRSWLPDLEAYRWLKAHTQPDEVVMTRVPWQLSFEADRPSLMIPKAPLVSDDPTAPTIMRAARYYGADYLVVNAMQGPRGESAAALQPLSRGEAILGFTPVYTGTAQFGRNPIRIYRFPADYAGVAPLQP